MSNKNMKILVLVLVASFTFQTGLGQNPSASKNSLLSNKKCNFVKEATFQGICVADWAIAISTTIRANLCAANDKLAPLSLSWQDLMCVCPTCLADKSFPCAGGSVSKGLSYLKDTGGIVGGGKFGLSKTKISWGDDATKTKYKAFGYCYDYYADKANPWDADKWNIKYDHAIACPSKCPNDSTITEKDVAKNREVVKGYKLLKDFNNISGKKQLETATGGKAAIIGYMTVYEDLMTFKGGDKNENVYVHTVGQSLGMYAVVILGYGVDKTTGLNYWDVLHPFGAQINAGRTVRVLKESNHCNIEEYAYTVTVNAGGAA